MGNWQWMACTALILGVGLSDPATADSIDPTATEVITGLKANDNVYKMYALGVIRGLWSANNAAIVNSKGTGRIYCPPDNLNITSDQAGNILEHYVEKYTSVRNLSGGAELTYALIELFPCH